MILADKIHIELCYTSGKVGIIDIIYTDFLGGAGTAVRIQRLLPLEECSFPSPDGEQLPFGKQYLPAILKYSRVVASEALKKQALMPELGADYEKRLLAELDRHLVAIDEKKRLLQDLMDRVPRDEVASAEYFSTRVNAAMDDLRALVDECEGLVDEEMWPVPSYGRMLTQNAEKFGARGV